MRQAGSMSWQIRSGLDKNVTTALYVRDAAGLGRYVYAEPDLPALWPPVEAQQVDVDLAEAIRQWQRWWPRVLRESAEGDLPPYPPHWTGLEGLPVIRVLVQEFFEVAQVWMEDARRTEIERTRRGSLHLTHFVNGYEGSLGRPVHPFTLWLREVPLESVAGWVLGPNSALVSTRLCDDEDAMEAFLRPLVDSLA